MPVFVLLLACQDHVDADAGQPSVDEDLRPQNPQFGHHVPQRSAHRPDSDEGVDAAAAAKGVEGVEVNYIYGGQFNGDGDITAVMDTWYSNGTQLVFACGGGIFTSAAEAAQKVNGKVIGVDTDQSAVIDGGYGEGMTVTSAMKGLAPTTIDTLTDVIVNGNWANYAGKIETLGLVSADDPSANYVQLPLETTQWADGKFTVEDYTALVADMFNGKVKVSNDTTVEPTVSNIAVNYLGNIKG